jgi:hypothetical protein
MQLFTQRPQNMMPSVIPDDVPVYRIKEGKFFADDTLFEEGAIIAYEKEPNVEMEPLNKLAIQKMSEYLQRLDALGKAKAEKDGKSYVSLEDAFKNAYSSAVQEGKTVNLLNGSKQVPLMGNSVKKQATVGKLSDKIVTQNPVRMTAQSERDVLNAADLI